MRLVGLAGAEVNRILKRLAEGRFRHRRQVVVHGFPALLEVRQHVNFTGEHPTFPGLEVVVLQQSQRLVVLLFLDQQQRLPHNHRIAAANRGRRLRE